MRIAIFSDCYLDLTGGIVSTINTEKAALEKRGHTVTVFSSAYPHSETELNNYAKQNIFPVPSCKVFGRGLTPIARRPKVIEKWLLKNHPEIKDYDIFYIHYEAGCSIAALRLAKELHIPSVQVMHGREDMGEAGLIPFGLRTLVAVLLNWFHSWYLPHPIKIHRDDYLATTIAKAKMWTMMVNHANFADLVITPSEHFKRKLIHYGVTKPIIALHHGIKDELISEPATERTFLPNDALRLVWHSRVSGEKRPMELLEALRLLHQKHTNYHLTVYGNGPALKRAKRYVRRHHLKVTFHGNTKFEKLWQAIKTSHLDILISYNYDTFGMTLIEAEAAGTPAFIVDPDMQEIIPAGSYLLAKGPEPVEMAAALEQIYQHPELITKMSQTMLKHRDGIRISQKISRLEQIFSDMVK